MVLQTPQMRYSQFHTSTYDTATKYSHYIRSNIKYIDTLLYLDSNCSGPLQKHFPNRSPYGSVPVITVVSTDQPIFRRILVHCATLPSHPDDFFYNPGGKLRVPLQRKYMDRRDRTIYFWDTCIQIRELHHTLISGHA